MWQGFKIRTEADLATHLDSFRILFAYNSNKIENDNTTYDDTYEVFTNDRVTGYTGDIRTITEIQNQKRAWLRTLRALTWSRSRAFSKNKPSRPGQRLWSANRNATTAAKSARVCLETQRHLGVL
jgi:hypothetical protein